MAYRWQRWDIGEIKALGRRGIKGGFQRKKGRGVRRFKTNGISLSCSQKPGTVPCHNELYGLTSCLLRNKFNFNLKFIPRLLKYRVILSLEASNKFGKVFKNLEKRIQVCLDVKGDQFQHRLWAGPVLHRSRYVYINFQVIISIT